MEMILLDDENLAREHICCAFSDKKNADGYAAKKAWLKTRFREGFRFRKLEVRGKVFIEYEPIESAWLPLAGAGFMVINCFWVSGRFKGQGHGKALLARAIADARAAGMAGVVAVTGEKKRPFMSDPKFLKAQGFVEVDQAPPFFRLLGMRLDPGAPWPQFLDSARRGRVAEKGIVANYSNACPYTELYVRRGLSEYAAHKGVTLKLNHITSRKEAHALAIPWVLNSVFYDGELVTLEMKANRHLDKLIT